MIFFPQHCIMPTFTPEQHATEVKNELIEAIQKLPKKTKAKIIKRLTKELVGVKEQQQARTTNEEDNQRIGEIPEVTASTTPTEPTVVAMAPEPINA